MRLLHRRQLLPTTETEQSSARWQQLHQPHQERRKLPIPIISIDIMTLEEFAKMAEEHGKKHGGIRCLMRYPSYQDGGREYMLALYNDGTYETRRA